MCCHVSSVSAVALGANFAVVDVWHNAVKRLAAVARDDKGGTPESPWVVFFLSLVRTADPEM